MDRECLTKHVTEGKIKDRSNGNQLLDDLKKKRGYWK
jgi:hypothetical protein